MAVISTQSIIQGQFVTAPAGFRMTVASLATSMTVNALVMGLIVYRIFNVFRQVRACASAEDQQVLGTPAGGSRLRSIMFILIESGTALFSIQLIRLVVVIVTTAAAGEASAFVPGMHQMLTVNYE